MAKYNKQFKLQIVKQYLSGAVGYERLFHEHDVGRTLIRRWVASYRQHGPDGLVKKFSHYSSAFKWTVLRRMQQENLSYEQVAALFNIRSPGSVAIWNRQYHSGAIEALAPRPRRRPKRMSNPKPTNLQTQAAPEDERTREQLLQENEYLRMEVAYLKNSTPRRSSA
jgi:transposase